MSAGILTGNVGQGKTTIAANLSSADVHDVLVLQACYNDRSNLATCKNLAFGDNCSLPILAINVAKVLEDVHDDNIESQGKVIAALSSTNFGLAFDELPQDKKNGNSASKFVKNAINVWGLSHVMGGVSRPTNVMVTKGAVRAPSLSTSVKAAALTKPALTLTKSLLKKIGIKGAVKAGAKAVPGAGWTLIGVDVFKAIYSRCAALAAAHYVLSATKETETPDDETENKVFFTPADFIKNLGKSNCYLKVFYRDISFEDEFISCKDFKTSVIYRSEFGTIIISKKGGILFLHSSGKCGFHMLNSESFPHTFVLAGFFNHVKRSGFVRMNLKPHILSGEHGAPIVMSPFTDLDPYSRSILAGIPGIGSVDSLVQKMTIIEPCWYDSLNSDSLSFANTALLPKGLPAGVVKFVSSYCARQTVLLLTTSAANMAIPLTAEAVAPFSAGIASVITPQNSLKISGKRRELIEIEDGVLVPSMIIGSLKDSHRFNLTLCSLLTFVPILGGRVMDALTGHTISCVDFVNLFNRCCQHIQATMPFGLEYNPDRDLIELTSSDNSHVLNQESLDQSLSMGYLNLSGNFIENIRRGFNALLKENSHE